MNSDEHAWDIADRTFGINNKKASSTADILRFLNQIWQEIRQDNIRNLTIYITNRLAVLKNAKGMSTKYKIFTL